MFILGHMGPDGDKHSSLLRSKLATVVKFFVTVSHFHPCLTFSGKDRSLPFEVAPLGYAWVGVELLRHSTLWVGSKPYPKL